MGIYIPGIETPKGHNYVTITIWHSGTASYGLFDREGNLSDFKSIKVAPVPAHGRCIDADEMLMRINHEVMEAYMDGVCYGVHPSQEYLYLLGEIIDDAPTIIPAEPAREKKN